MGKPLFFIQNANDTPTYLTEGWSCQEAKHRWTDGQEVSMKMNIQNAENENLLLSLDANAYLGGGLRHQNINVFVNDQQIAVWEMAGRKWYEAQIPASVVGDGLLNISFQISHPTAPCEVSNSKDCRKLGMAVSELLIKQDMR